MNEYRCIRCQQPFRLPITAAVRSGTGDPGFLFCPNCEFLLNPYPGSGSSVLDSPLADPEHQREVASIPYSDGSDSATELCSRCGRPFTRPRRYRGRGKFCHRCRPEPQR